jgi:hypothetical protein
MTPITYISEQPKDWAEGLNHCETLAQLRDYALAWRMLCPDAYQIVEKMSDQDFDQWQDGLKKERKGRFAGDEFAIKFDAVLLPETLFRVSIVAMQCHVPWGCAYLRLMDKDG